MTNEIKIVPAGKTYSNNPLWHVKRRDVVIGTITQVYEAFRVHMGRGAADSATWHESWEAAEARARQA